MSATHDHSGPVPWAQLLLQRFAHRRPARNNSPPSSDPPGTTAGASHATDSMSATATTLARPRRSSSCCRGSPTGRPIGEPAGEGLTPSTGGCLLGIWPGNQPLEGLTPQLGGVVAEHRCGADEACGDQAGYWCGPGRGRLRAASPAAAAPPHPPPRTAAPPHRRDRGGAGRSGRGRGWPPSGGFRYALSTIRIAANPRHRMQPVTQEPHAQVSGVATREERGQPPAGVGG
jgi:hypothetical protein